MVTIFQAHIRNGVVVPDAPLDLPDGAAVDVRIVDSAPQQSNRSVIPARRGACMLELLETMPPPGVFKSSLDADEYLQIERDSWAS